MLEKPEVVDYLWSIRDRAEIKEFWDILKRRSRQLEEQIATNFNVGEEVKFKGKYGKTEQGKITQINRKSISIRTETNLWRVSPSLLERV